MVKTLILNGSDLTFSHLINFINGEYEKVSLDVNVKEAVTKCRKKMMNGALNKPVYGVNMGFGQHQDVPVSKDGLNDLQRNLIITHAVSFGDQSNTKVIEIAMILRINALAKGFSGVRYELLEKLLEILNNKRITPYVPKIGSLGASGDLSPLSHIALVLIGEGVCFLDNKLVKTSKALNECNIDPIVLQEKEGLALNNGMQFTTAHYIYELSKLKNHVTLLTVLSGNMTEIMLGSDAPYNEEIHNLRPHEGQKFVASILRNAFKNSGIRQSHKSFEFDKNTQDPYSSRTLPQVIGTFFDTFQDAIKTINIEINSATDNPLVLRDGSVVSGGNFHGMPIAISAANVFNSFISAVKISEALVRRIVDSDKNRINSSCLMSPFADHSISSGMMIIEYTYHAHVNKLVSLNNQTFLSSASSASGQEDHVSHAPTVVLALEESIELFETLLALKSVMVMQGYYVLKESETKLKNNNRIDPEVNFTPGDVGKIIIKTIEPHFPPMSKDRFMQQEILDVKNNLISNFKLFNKIKNLI